MRDDDESDFVDNVEERMLTHIALLDRMIVDADREILRLEELLAATDVLDAPGQSLSSGERPGSPSINGGWRMRLPDARVFRPADTAGDQKKAA